MPGGIDKFHDVSAQNKKKILEFCEDIEVLKTASSKHTIDTYRSQVIKLSRYLGDTTFKEVSKKKMKEFFSYLESINCKKTTQNTLAIVIRRFYRWLYELDTNDDLPDCVRWLKLSSAGKLYKVDIEKIEDKTVTDEEYELLLEHAETKYLKAILEVFKYYGVRNDELCSMKIQGVGNNEVGVYITVIRSKTRPRQITLDDHYPQHLLDWLDINPLRGQPDAPVFPNFTKRKSVYMKALKTQEVRHLLKKITEDAGISKNITPHTFRHTCITWRLCICGWGSYPASKFFAVSPRTIEMVYAHNSDEALLEWQKQQKIKRGLLEPSMNEIKAEKQKLESEYEERVKQMEQKFEEKMEQKFEEKMEILDNSGMSKSARKYDVPSQKIIEDHERLKMGVEMYLNKMIIEGKSQSEIEKLRKLLSAGLA